MSFQNNNVGTYPYCSLKYFDLKQKVAKSSNNMLLSKSKTHIKNNFDIREIGENVSVKNTSRKNLQLKI